LKADIDEKLTVDCKLFRTLMTSWLKN